jgi:hypothetical protein
LPQKKNCHNESALLLVEEADVAAVVALVAVVVVVALVAAYVVT